MKTVFAFVLCTVIGAASFAQPAVGISAGWMYRVDDYAAFEDLDYSIEDSFVPVLLTALWQLPIEGVSAGLRGGFQRLVNIEEKDGPFTFGIETIPVLLTVRYERGLIYGEAGAGMHRWSLKYRTSNEVIDGEETTVVVNNLDESGIHLALFAGAGVRVQIGEHLHFHAGPCVSMYAIPEIGTGKPANNLEIGALAGISWYF